MIRRGRVYPSLWRWRWWRIPPKQTCMEEARVQQLSQVWISINSDPVKERQGTRGEENMRRSPTQPVGRTGREQRRNMPQQARKRQKTKTTDKDKRQRQKTETKDKSEDKDKRRTRGQPGTGGIRNSSKSCSQENVCGESGSCKGQRCTTSPK